MLALDFGNIIYTTIGGFVGYAFREYKNRLQPFLQILHIEGTMVRSEDSANITEVISTKLKDSYFVGSLDRDASLGDVLYAHERAASLKFEWPICERLVEAFLKANDKQDAISLLTKPFENRVIDDSLSTLLLVNHISVPSIAKEAEQIKIGFNDEAAFINFPAGVRSFGEILNLSNPMVRSRINSFLELVSYLEIEALKQLYRQYQEIMRKEYFTANDVFEPLNEIINSNSRWILRCYIANINATPLVLHRKLFIQITDRKDIKYHLAAYLAAIEVNQDGNSEISDLGTPLVLESGSSRMIAAVTAEAQCEMRARTGPIGTAVRECFERGQARCTLELSLRRVGLFGKQQFRSPAASFIQGSSKRST